MLKRHHGDNDLCGIFHVSNAERVTFIGIFNTEGDNCYFFSLCELGAKECWSVVECFYNS